MSKSKWEFSVLFDADQKKAEQVLERYGVLVMDAVKSASAAVRRIDDLEAWEKCMCGQVERVASNQDSERDK